MGQGDLVSYLVCHQRRFLPRSDPVDDGDELVSAQPRSHVVLADAVLKPSSHGLKHDIADIVAKRVIDGLETVQIEKKHCCQVIRLLRPPRNDGIEPDFQQVAVRKSGQGIVVSKLRQVLLRILVRGHVDHHPAQLLRTPFGIANYTYMVAYPDDLAAGCHHAIDNLTPLVEADRLLIELHCACTVFRIDDGGAEVRVLGPVVNRIADDRLRLLAHERELVIDRLCFPDDCIQSLNEIIEPPLRSSRRLAQLFPVALYLRILPVEVDEHQCLGSQYFRNHRFDHVIDSTGFIALEDADLVQAIASKKYDGSVIGTPPLPDQPGSLKTIHSGHLRVQQDQRELLIQDVPECLFTGVRLDKVKVQILEQGFQRHQASRIVIDQQYTGVGSAH